MRVVGNRMAKSSFGVKVLAELLEPGEQSFSRLKKSMAHPYYGTFVPGFASGQRHDETRKNTPGGEGDVAYWSRYLLLFQ